jgi:RimJ/RimL family protein N-acetyltransferase
MTPPLETRRLLLRPLALADAEQIQPLFAHWEVVRLLSSRVPWPYPPDGALKHLRDEVLPAVERGDAWAWSLRLKTRPAQLIGTITLHRGGDENRGFWLGVPWQGQGLMTEACDAVTDHWFEELGFPVLRTAQAIANAASRHISLTQGMRVIRTETRESVSGRLPSEIWELTRESWLARQGGGQRTKP